MKYYYLVNKIISEFIFPNLNTSQRTFIIRCVVNVVNELDSYIKLYSMFQQLSLHSYRDIYMIVNMIIPFIAEDKKRELRDLEEIPTKFTNLQYNLGEKYKFDIDDIQKSTDHLINETIPKVIYKLHLNWIDILPDLDENDGFHSKIIFQTDLDRSNDNEKGIYEHIQKNIRENENKWKDAVYYMLSDEKKTVTFGTKKNHVEEDSKYQSLYDEYKDLTITNDKPYDQNWFNVEAFNWLSQIHFFNHFLSNRVIFLTAGTGVGKSTHIPKLALYTLMAFEDIKEPKIIVTQPRQIPASDVPTYISKHFGLSIKNYKEKFDDKNISEEDKKTKDISDYYIQFQHGDDKHTKKFKKKEKKHRFIKYETDQLLINELIENPRLWDDEQNDTLYDIIMIDEAHEHNIRMDMILTLIKNTLKLNKKIRLMIISATMEDDEARYREFYKEIDDPNDPEKCIDRRLHIANPLEKNRFPIKEHFENKPVLDYIEAGIEKINYILKTSSQGDILFFLTGQAEIDSTCDRLNSELPSYVITLPLYAELSDQNKEYAKSILPRKIDIDRKTVTLPIQNQTFNSKGTYTRKIILATNIAEASITISNLTYVIDIGFTKSNIYDPNVKLGKLESVPISMSSHSQRRGRVGRKAPGEAFFLYTHNDIKNNKIIPDITISDLSGDIFQLLKNDESGSVSDSDDNYIKKPNSDESDDSDVNDDYEIGFEKDRLYDKDGSFYIVHPAERSKIERSLENGHFIINLDEQNNKLIHDAFENLRELKLIDPKGYRTKLGKFILKLNKYTKLIFQTKITFIYAIQTKTDKIIIPIIAFTDFMKYKTFFTDPEKGLQLFGHKLGDHATIFRIYHSFISRFTRLFINEYSLESYKELKNTIDNLDDIEDNTISIQNLSDEDQLSRIELQKIKRNIQYYTTKYNIKINKKISDNINNIIDHEIKLISDWCSKKYIDVYQLKKYLIKITIYNLYKKQFKLLLKTSEVEPYNTSSSVMLNNIIKILKDSNPRNVGFVGNKGIYENKYNVALDINTMQSITEYKKIPLTSYQGYSKKIYYSNIRHFEDSTQIEYISKLYL